MKTMRVPRRRWGLLVISLAWMLVWAVTLVDGVLEEDRCEDRCAFQNKTEDGSVDAGCSSDCRIEQCSLGCQLWQRALLSSCQQVCNATEALATSKQLYCIMGCNDALSTDYHRLRDKVGTPPAPALVADTLTATSLVLEWDGPLLSNATYLVQWRYEDVAGEWHYCRNHSWRDNGMVLVDSLQPYTKYRFRIAVLFSSRPTEAIFSSSSVVVSTLPQGVPLSAPSIVRGTAVDARRIAVSWAPGPFPNGPVLSYLIKIERPLNQYSAIRDIPDSENTHFHMFRNLEPNSEYVVSVSMRNAVGEGPAAKIVLSTPPEPNVTRAFEPTLVIASQHNVKFMLANILAESSLIYNTSDFIEGMAVHIGRKLLLVSESSGYVTRMSLENPHTDFKRILGPTQLNFAPLDLSLDWLNEQIYILGQTNHSSGLRWQVARCGLDGRGLTVAVAGFLSRPKHIEVDPYNGYLFWVMHGPTKAAGLYRLDLADISNGVHHEVNPELILEHPALGAFTVDHTNFRLLVPDHNENTIYSISLDGKEVLDLRANTQRPMFQNVTSLASVNGLFYWTNGKEVLTEEYHSGQDTFYHNAFPDLLSDSAYRLITVLSTATATQPTPVPVNPPTQVQAILGAELAKASWRTPHLLGGQGKGAWQNWSYELVVREEMTGDTVSIPNINATGCTIQKLKENTEYVIKTTAYTSAGRGPWSAEYKGKTLRIPSDGKYPSIVWSAAEGLLKSDVTGENVETFIHKSQLEESGHNYHVIDMAWFRDRLYLVTNASTVLWYNLTSHERGQLRDLDSVAAIAVDWLGHKLYWSNPKQQLISRGSLNGTQQEPLPILTGAKELKVDAISAFLYWSTGHAVEFARLNGESRSVYYPGELFSGKQVMGLTLDTDRKAVYWIVRSFEGSNLYQASMASADSTPEKALIFEPALITSLQHPTLQGPLCYFSDRLLWLQDQRNAIIGDLYGQNTAILSGLSLSSLHMVAVIDPSLHSQLNTSNHVMVIPAAVDSNSLRITGIWNNFTIEWNPVDNVNHGELFYEVTIDDGQRNKDRIEITRDQRISYPGAYLLRPFSKIHASVRAYTYWGASGVARAYLLSPPSIPSPPERPRAYIVLNPGRQDLIHGLVRWDKPAMPNGAIEGYEVHWWTDGTHENIVDLKAHPLEFETTSLLKNTTYYFQIRAYTKIGFGNGSTICHLDTSEELVVPRLLLAREDNIALADLDLGSTSFIQKAIRPFAISSLHLRNQVFWLEGDRRHLHSAHWQSMQLKDLLTLNSTALSLAVDWLAEYLYWSELDVNGGGSSIWRIDLNAHWARPKPIKILHRTKKIVALTISPFTSALYWVESNRNGPGILMTSYINGKNIHPLFDSITHSRGNKCNCPVDVTVGPTLSLDHSNLTSPKIFWTDALGGGLYLSDTSGCLCQEIANLSATEMANSSLTVDSQAFYWTSFGRVFNLSRNPSYSSDEVIHLTESNVRSIMTLSYHSQPYPEWRCLAPNQDASYQAQVLYVDDRNIRVEFPEPERNPGCPHITMASWYKMHFGLLSSCNSSTLRGCTNITTTERIARISDLKPFTIYAIIIRVGNQYLEKPQAGSPCIVTTLPGVPSSPQKVIATPMDPVSALITWHRPYIFNGESINYEVLWQMNSSVAGERQRGELPAAKGDVSDDNDYEYQATLTKLVPGLTYLVTVRAYAAHSRLLFADSKSVYMQMYHEPESIHLETSSVHTLNVSWFIPGNYTNYTLECQEMGSSEWTQVVVAYNSSTTSRISYLVSNLLAKTQYSFRLAIQYNPESGCYNWPTDTRFTFETLGDRPGPPGTPSVQQIKHDVYKLRWDPARDNGAPIELYALEGRIDQNDSYEDSSRARRETDSDSSELDSDWNLYYNGTENSWLVTELAAAERHIFRVRARNSHGWGEWSPSSKPLDTTAAAFLAEGTEWAIVIIISGTLLFVIFVVFFSIFIVCRRRVDKCKTSQVVGLVGAGSVAGPGSSGGLLAPDVELATLRELPRRFVHNTNALYAEAPPTDAEVALLPRLRRDQIKLTKFLGAGAFGEVFEGVANDETRVAIKTLRKGATEQEKAEFLKEATLMSNFRHEHILQLLGVCLDNDPNFIIMELMEGGDLLTYLRSNRPNTNSSGGLNFNDLLAMCVDVARGCRYLEEMHFVHRDLACRNCLVSSTDPQTRVVKIGDFGLARDIYKNDYYRKEGEGLLPVRWMAPESLVDGVFTCQSDVWSFGVLAWEIITLGQQPYPARNNLEVLHYVRTGGRLTQPPDCPQPLHELMLQCWSFNPEARPTFKHCLSVLEALQAKGPVTAVTNGHYVTRANCQGGLENRGFFQDDNHNNMPASGSMVRPTPATSYIELLYDSEEDSLQEDGHRIEEPSSPAPTEGPTSETYLIANGTRGLTDPSVSSDDYLVPRQ